MQLTKSQEEVSVLEINLEMADGCLNMIREALEWTGEDMSHTPAMNYDDAIRISWSKQSVRAEKAEIERDVLLHMFVNAELREAMEHLRTKKYKDAAAYRVAVKTTLSQFT